MVSRSLNALFLRSRDAWASLYRLSSIVAGTLITVHLIGFWPFLDHLRAQAEQVAGAEREIVLSRDLAGLEAALREADQSATQALDAALGALIDGINEDLARLAGTVDTLHVEIPVADEETTSLALPPLADLPFAIDDPDSALDIREATTSQELLRTLRPLVEQQIVRPRFAAADRAWKDELSRLEPKIDAIAGQIPRIRARFTEADKVWESLAAALGNLRRLARDLDLQPPPEPYWWATETAEDLTLRPAPAVDERLRAPVAADAVTTAARQSLERATELQQQLQQIRTPSSRPIATDQRRWPRELATAFPAFLGLALAVLLVLGSSGLRELGLTTSLVLRNGGPESLRDWFLNQAQASLHHEPAAARAARGWYLRAGAVSLAALAWITLACFQLFSSGQIDERRIVIAAAVGGTIVLLALIHRLLTIRAVNRLYEESEPDRLNDDSATGGEAMTTGEDAAALYDPALKR